MKNNLPISLLQDKNSTDRIWIIFQANRNVRQYLDRDVTGQWNVSAHLEAAASSVL